MIRPLQPALNDDDFADFQQAPSPRVSEGNLLQFNDPVHSKTGDKYSAIAELDQLHSAPSAFSSLAAAANPSPPTVANSSPNRQVSSPPTSASIIDADFGDFESPTPPIVPPQLASQSFIGSQPIFGSSVNIPPALFGSPSHSQPPITVSLVPSLQSIQPHQVLQFPPLSEKQPALNPSISPVHSIAIPASPPAFSSMNSLSNHSMPESQPVRKDLLGIQTQAESDDWGDFSTPSFPIPQPQLQPPLPLQPQPKQQQEQQQQPPPAPRVATPPESLKIFAPSVFSDMKKSASSSSWTVGTRASTPPTSVAPVLPRAPSPPPFPADSNRFSPPPFPPDLNGGIGKGASTSSIGIGDDLFAPSALPNKNHVPFTVPVAGSNGSHSSQSNNKPHEKLPRAMGVAAVIRDETSSVDSFNSVDSLELKLPPLEPSGTAFNKQVLDLQLGASRDISSSPSQSRTSPNSSPAHSIANSKNASFANSLPVSDVPTGLSQPPLQPQPQLPPSPRHRPQSESPVRRPVPAAQAALSVAPGAQLVAVWKRVLSATREKLERVNVLVLDALSALASPGAKRDARHRPSAAAASATASECADFLAALAAHERFRALIGVPREAGAIEHMVRDLDSSLSALLHLVAIAQQNNGAASSSASPAHDSSTDRCALCLQPCACAAPEESESSISSGGAPGRVCIVHNESLFHAACANLWLHAVDANPAQLPTLVTRARPPP